MGARQGKNLGSSKKQEEQISSSVPSEKEDEKTKLAWYKLSGYGDVDVDVNGAVALLEERVAEGDLEAMWMLGICNEFGIGTEQNIERAEKLYKQSSEGGNEIGNILMKNKSREYERGSGYLGRICLL